MLLGAKERLAERRMALIKRTLNKAIEGIPRWSRRVSDMDRDILIQALSDLEHLHDIVGEYTFKGLADEAAKEPPK